VNHYFKRIRDYFYNRARGEHEDLTQETFKRVVEKHGDYRGGSFRGFLFGIARLVLFEFYRERHKVQQIDPEVDSLPSLGSGRISTQLSRREDLRLLYDALTQLCFDDLDLLELYYFQQLSGPELAALFGIPLPTIRGRIAAARKRLAKAHAELANSPHDKLISDQEIEQRLGLLREELAKQRRAGAAAAKQPPAP